MTAELIALTQELERTTAMLAKVIVRLDEADRRANRHRMWTGLLAVSVVAVSVLGGLFISDARHERDRICTAMVGGFEQYTEALIAASNTTPRTPAQEELRAKQIAEFRAQIASRLATCS